MILIHAFLFFRRSRSGTEAMRRLGQGVFDRFCDDMDANLREMGIGDLAVPKHMQRIGEAFYGRATAYDAALDANDDSALAQAVIAERLRGEPQQPERAQRLAAYIKAADAQLAQRGRHKSGPGADQLSRPAKLSDVAPMSQTNQRSKLPWNVAGRVSEIPEGGKRFDLVADEATRAAGGAARRICVRCRACRRPLMSRATARTACGSRARFPPRLVRIAS